MFYKFIEKVQNINDVQFIKYAIGCFITVTSKKSKHSAGGTAKLS